MIAKIIPAAKNLMPTSRKGGIVSTNPLISTVPSPQIAAASNNRPLYFKLGICLRCILICGHYTKRFLQM